MGGVFREITSFFGLTPAVEHAPPERNLVPGPPLVLHAPRDGVVSAHERRSALAAKRYSVQVKAAHTAVRVQAPASQSESLPPGVQWQPNTVPVMAAARPKARTHVDVQGMIPGANTFDGNNEVGAIKAEGSIGVRRDINDHWSTGPRVWVNATSLEKFYGTDRSHMQGRETMGGGFVDVRYTGGAVDDRLRPFVQVGAGAVVRSTQINLFAPPGQPEGLIVGTKVLPAASAAAGVSARIGTGTHLAVGVQGTRTGEAAANNYVVNPDGSKVRVKPDQRSASTSAGAFVAIQFDF